MGQILPVKNKASSTRVGTEVITKPGLERSLIETFYISLNDKN